MTVAWPVEQEEEPEPEIDLSALTAKQLALADRPVEHAPENDADEVDASILAKSGASKPRDRALEANSRKGKTVLVEWDEQLDEMARDKAAAEALSGAFILNSMIRGVCEAHIELLDLKARLKKQAAAPKPLKPPRKKEKELVCEYSQMKCEIRPDQHTAVPPPLEPGRDPAPAKDEKETMQDFLDDLLA